LTTKLNEGIIIKMKKLHNSRGPEVDIEKCVEAADGNRFNMILMAAARSREIRKKFLGSERPEHQFPNVTSLLDIQNGKVGREYLRKIK
jgi:DNA-directed RNA polymerase subunit K/omega